MNSELKLYFIGFEEDERYMLEDIEAYLNTLTATTIASNFQYIPLRLEQTIKIPINQQKLNPLALGNPFFHNYLRVLPKATDEADPLRLKPSYYYIKGSRWISRECIELDLKLDTLNTLPVESSPLKANYIIDKKTFIRREHKKRFQAYDGRQYLKVDKLSEGINPTLYNKEKVKFIGDSDEILHNFYLIYKNNLEATDPNNIVRAYLTLDNKDNNIRQLSVSYESLSRFIQPSHLNIDLNYYFVRDSSDFSIDILQGSTTSSITIDSSNFVRFLYNDDNKIILAKYTLNAGGVSTTLYEGIDGITAPLNSIVYYSKARTFQQDNIKSFPYITLTATRTKIGNLIPYNQVNIADSKIVKIIKLPYSPIGAFSYSAITNRINYDEDIYSFDEQENLLYVNDTSKLFHKTLEAQTRLSNIYGNYVSSFNPNDLRNIQYEPKLYHSDFQYKKLVYDSFSLIIKGEELTAEGFRQYPLRVDFYTTTTINSRFALKINENYFTESSGDYPYILYINRNNEMVLYNSDYINYIKNGYNYDKKKQERQLLTSTLTAGIGIAGAVGSALLGSTGIGAGVAVGLATSSANTLINTIKGNIEAESNIEQKMKQLQNQAVNVIGADDVDILEVYTDNKAYIYTYECSDEMKQMLFDLFYYTGYKANYYGIPNLNSRYWFNYIECDLNLSKVKPFIENEVIEDLKEKFKNGITLFHLHNGVYDLNQEKENWESDLINE